MFLYEEVQVTRKYSKYKEEGTNQESIQSSTTPGPRTI